MEEVLENIVALVEQHEAGIPLNKLAVFYNQKYHKNLTLSSLGFNSVSALVASLDEDLVVEGKMVFRINHPHHRNNAGRGAKAAGPKKTEDVLDNVVSMMKQQPAGIPMKKVAIVYSQTYRRNLTLSSLGFESMEALVDSVGEDLVVDGGVVFHKDHRGQASLKEEAVLREEPQKRRAGATSAKTTTTTTTTTRESRSTAPQGTKPLVEDTCSTRRCSSPKVEVSPHYVPSQQASNLLGAPLISAPCPLPVKLPCAAFTPVQPVTPQQLYQRVIEVTQKYKLNSLSMEQLKTLYTHEYGEPLPLPEYMSLYDSLGASAPKNAAVQDEPPTTVSQATTAANHLTRAPEKEPPQQRAAVAECFSSSDFPELNATKGQKSKPRERESTRPVFKEAYHAQLRELHGGNLRALEAMRSAEDEEEEGALWGRRRRSSGSRVMDPEKVNSLMEDVKREIASEGEWVTQEKVISRACVLLQVPSLDALRIRSWQIPALKDLQYMIREINMFIESTEAVTSICTLYELGHSLAALKDKKHFEELNLGPLCKLPLIHRMFKIDCNTKDDDIHQIETVDILKQLRNFRKKRAMVKVDLAEFMKYLADQYSCESPYELGIRIHSVALPISTLLKVSRNEHAILTEAREAIQRELVEETQDQLRKVKRSIMETLPGASGSSSFSSTGCAELRKKYACMAAVEVVLAVFSNAEGVFSPRMKKTVQSFLVQVSGDRLATALFQLAICGGSLAVPQDLVPKDKPPQPGEQQQTPNKDQHASGPSLPSEAKLKQFLKDSLSAYNSAVTLAHVASLEKKLTKHFLVKDFLSLEQGNFLEFLAKHNQLLQETLGSTLFLGSGGTDLGARGFRPTKQDVFEFIKQCGDTTSTEPEELFHIESALRSHYGVRDSRDLGYGTLQTLAHLVQRMRGLGGGGGLSQVYYESAIFAKHSKSSAEGGCETVGRLGEMSKAQALNCLLSCPLLEDLSEWSQWELIFKPAHGPLKDFIERNAANSGLAALEVTPGRLLRITTHTGDKQFSSAAVTLDPVGTAGHLVSMVVADGIDNAPTALLANHMQSSLALAVAKEDFSQAEEDVSCYSRVAHFLLACLRRIPSRTCQALLQQVFLEPFSRVLGQAKSKQVLVAAARSDPQHVNCLHRLGILLGITEWVKDFQKKLSPPPQSQNHSAHTPHVEQAKSNLLDSQSSSLSALNTSEEEDFEENHMDNSFASSQLNHSLQPAGEQDVEVEVMEEEDEEELFELAPVPNGDVTDVCVEAEEGPEKGEHSEMSDGDENASSPQRAVVEDIRKNEFGIGVELNADGKKLMQIQQDRLGRSLERLSTELYSKDTHFVLELIQNADDNGYPAGAGVAPSLAFVVERDCITVLNNEVGFQEKNIRAICDVGRSTKGKHKYGYIGQKGIGFKSVFKVTDCPEIHSNGFHLRFDKTCGVSMGYILPHWFEDQRPLESQLSHVNQSSWTTKIRLPLRRSENHQTRNLFHDVHPSLLLFLHRLRSITIYNGSENHLVTMTRKDLSHDVVEVEHTEGVERWLVVKTPLKPKIKEDVESTELALAFQLCGDNTGSDMACQPQKQPVFAYLPLRSFGFRFIVQGDFDIPSSREDVDRDSSWNQWLRSEIPQLFLQAMGVFTNHPEFSGLKGLCRFLQFIPLPDEVLDFFKPVAGQIIKLLKGQAFLPTLSSDGRVVYKLPSQVAVCQDAVIREVIGGDELERHLSLSYLHPSLSPAPPTSLLSHLGVRDLRGSDVTTVTTAMAKELMRVEGIHSDHGLRQLARLLVCNFRALEYGYGEADSVLQCLKDLPIIPLADGRVVALSGEGVFFPMEETKTTKKKKSQVQSGPLSALYRDVSVVHPSLLSCVEPLESQQVRELLRKLGVHELEPQELLEQHIYPTIRSSKWKSKSEAVVVSYLVFIKQHSSSSREYSDCAVPVLTSRGLLNPGLDRVHFSEEYGNVDLTETLPGCDWVLLSPCYVETDGDVSGWRELFSSLGVRDGLIIRKQTQTLNAQDLASSPWSAESAAWPQRPGEAWVLEDFPCEEFEALVAAQLPGSFLLQQREALLKLLASNWDTGHRYSQYLKAQVVDGDGRPIRSTSSSFYHSLRRAEWVPAYRLMEAEPPERKFLCPNSVYLTSPEVTALLGAHVHYVDLEPSEFSRDLGMRQSLSVDALITYLKAWCVEPDADAAGDEVGGANFTSTVQHIHNVYTYLHTNCPQSSLKELFQHTPAVFIEYNRRASGWCSGRFYHLKEVCWSDTTTMFHRYKQLTHGADCPVQEPKVLAPFYSPLEGMKDFFIRLLNVEQSPNMNQYVGLLELICASSPIPTAEVLQDVSVLYARLAQKCKIPMTGEQDLHSQSNLNTSYCSTLKGMVSDKKVFPTKDNSWVSLARKPMMADNKELEKIFKSHKQVCLLHLPPPQKKPGTFGHTGERASVPSFSEGDRLLFMEICRIRPLSQCVRAEPQTENFWPCPSMQAMVRSVVPYVQRFLHHHEELAHVYADLVRNNIGEKVKCLRFGQVGKLYIRYQLDIADSDETVVELQDVICLLKDEKELYIQKDHLTAKLDICRELVKLFCTERSHRKELMHFLCPLITILNEPAALKRLLQKEDIRELPEDQEPWEIPEPPKPEEHLERVFSRSTSSLCSVEEPARPAQEDGEQTLVCWPPRASLNNTGSGRAGQSDGGAVEAVMKMWPPPAGPKDRGPEKEVVPREGGQLTPQRPRGAEQPGLQRGLSQPGQPLTSDLRPAPPATEHSHRAEPSGPVRVEKGGVETLAPPRPAHNPPSASPAESAGTQPAANSLVVPEAVVLSSSSVFQGASSFDAHRPPLNLDFPLWNKAQLPQDFLEDMELTCRRPTTVVLSEDTMDVAEIGEWGEQLVYSFLCHWRDSGAPGRPADVLWCNQSGESGQPYDFKLSWEGAGPEREAPAAMVVYVEVKATVKKEKSFIHLSANELDFALKEKEKYHIFRVYSAGDAQHVRLCRIQNLAQHLHTKDLALYLFV